MPEKTIYTGAFVHCKTLKELEICASGSIGVDEAGKIAFISPSSSTPPPPGWTTAKTIRPLGPHAFFFPGFIDTHTHAPQFPNAGLFGSTTLLSWLSTYTFPTESRFASLAFARRVYARVVARLLSHGTTCAAYYATVHVPATNLLAELCHERGQRAFVGRVCMDRMSPDYYRDESAGQAVADSRASLEFIRELGRRGQGEGQGDGQGLEGHLVQGIVTPRFAPSCSEEAMRGLGELAREWGVRVQTHVSENRDEVEMVRGMWPDRRDYVDVYDEMGLLGERTVLAHAIWLSEEERRIIKERRTKISHCPCSNTCLTSGTAKVRTLLDDGIDVGLGTDVSGGYSGSMLEEVRQAILVSRHVAMEEGDKAKLSFEEGLWLATRGGAKVLGLEDRVGGFEVGMEWDAQMINLGSVGEDGALGEDDGLVDVYGEEKWNDVVAKWVYTGDDRNTQAVWVKGRLVHSRPGVQL
ncbi:amidohydrolase-like protein 1 [Elsinoe australis]|uniref:Guanine deaminase n=1 Tax=Elsinoe australis TaxID=40998 RepID=A0A4U7B8C9_9PEZI|nr:amidohydrolase-like protein 1 [Elsinoe australis]